MTGYTAESLLSDALDHGDAHDLLQQYLPGLISSPLLAQMRLMPLGQVVAFGGSHLDDGAVERLWASLAAVEATVAAPRVEAPAIDPDPAYEASSVERGSAVPRHPDAVERWRVFELSLDGPDHGNPFVDVDLHATFTSGGGAEVRVGGFYDGGGRYVVRYLPPEDGEWTFVTDSTARSLDGVAGAFTVTGPAPDNHGPVRVADTFHFAHADGTRHLPLGTTAYAWTHQPDELQEQTLDTLAASPFTKLRMCLFPKAYLFNTNDPDRYPFVQREDGSFDLARFDPEYFARLEERLRRLDALGVQADLILFHAYDRWGFSDLGRAADDRYLRYVVRRLAAFANVWWSLANEYDLLRAKTEDDLERFAAIVGEEDPSGHLLSIHNCFGFYDHSRPWVTHASVQRVDVYRTAENTDEWREQWGKPVVIDECAYEGDIDQGWGNISGEELTRRFWEGAVRGGYVGHGETYLNDREELWWSKGGELVGTSPDRIRFLAEITAESPTGVLEPLPSDWDVRWGGVAGRYLIAYFGFGRPRYRDVVRTAGVRYTVDVIDTWNMTIDRLPGEYEGAFRVPLPGREHMAIRLIAVE
ncbi:DUF5605 domain-containing protein [Leifsonia sp. NPDC058194]|uniref:DUF5605 domain-containing protein n=1 Tax=Leifsonia sp. NPDC058194 TaxID=3346374 RepID=UPI0036D9862B